jgi:hypothetical protein
LRELVAEPVVGALLCGSVVEPADEDEVHNQDRSEQGQHHHRRGSHLACGTPRRTAGATLVRRAGVELGIGFELKFSMDGRRLGDGHVRVNASRRRRANRTATMPRYVTAPPTTAEVTDCPPVRASGATFVVVRPRTDGSPEPVPPVEPPLLGVDPASVVAVVLDESDDEEEEDKDDEDEDEDVVDVVVVVCVPVDHVSPFGSVPLAVNVTTTFQNLSP